MIDPAAGCSRGRTATALSVAGAALAIGGLTGLMRRRRRDRAAALRRLADVDMTIVEAARGPVEYAQNGSGPALLVSHGIFHGADGGLLSVRHLVEGRRVIAPSRFGYLGSPLPPGAAGADQADAFANLLDHLDLGVVDVLGISAGTGPAVQLALRHPDRVRHLVILSGNLPGSPTAVAPPGWARLFYSDSIMWALKTLAPPVVSRLMGVPPGHPRNPVEAEQIDELVESIFPLDRRVAGAINDAYLSNPEIERYPLEELRVPTLLIHARDDPLASYEAAVEATERIPGATLLTVDSGGHLLLGQDEVVRAGLAGFLDRPPDRSD